MNLRQRITSNLVRSAPARAGVPPASADAPRAEPPEPRFEPSRVLEVEIGRPLPSVRGVDEHTGRLYRRGLALVRLHTHPLGLLDLRFDASGLSASEYADRIWRALAPEILAHLRQDDLPEVSGLGAAGLPMDGVPACNRGRERFLATAPLVSVIIPTSNRAERLAACLDSVLACDYPRFEIIVVDNVPKTPATADLVRAYQGKARYLREDRPGSAIARNRGLEIATGEIVAFTDDDVVVDTYWLSELASAFRAADRVGCVTGLIVPGELETQAQEWFEQYGGFGKGFTRLVYDLKGNRPDDPLFPFNAGMFGSGNNMAFRRSVLQEIKGFDPMLGNSTPALGGVDIDAFFRVIMRGSTLVYEPAAFVYHAHRREYAGLRKQIYSFAAGMTAFQTKSLLRNPRLVPGFLRMLPAGLRFTLSPASGLHLRKQSDYPKELTHVDRRGMLYGPVAYLRSWWWWRMSVPRDRSRHRGPIGSREGTE